MDDLVMFLWQMFLAAVMVCIFGAIVLLPTIVIINHFK